MLMTTKKENTVKEVNVAFYEAAREAAKTLREHPDVKMAGVICFDDAGEFGPTYYWVQEILYSQKWEDFLKNEGVSCHVCSIPSYESKPLVWLTLD